MGWYWNPVGVPGLLAAAVAYALAAVVLFTSPGRKQNRRLAFVLFLEGTTDLFGGGLLFFTDTYAMAFAAQATAFLAFGVMVLAYPFFLSTLPSPLTRPLRRPWVDAVLVAIMLAFTVWFLVRTPLFLAGVAPAPISRLLGVGGPLMLPVLILPSLGVFFYGLLAAVTMWRSAPAGSAARRQGGIYATAFALRDVAWTAFLLNGFVFGSWFFGPQHFNLVLIVFYATLAYGILRFQLFDIDIRIKTGLGRGAVAITIAGAFFLASETAEALLPVRGYIPGLVAAAVVTLAALPLYRFAMRGLNRFMPEVQDTEEYRRRRKQEVLAAAIEDLARDGRLSARDQAHLARLRRKLGLPTDEVA